MNRLTATVLCGGLALAGCDRSDFRPEQLEAASRQGAETGQTDAEAVLQRLDGGAITAENIADVRFETPEGHVLSLVRLCSANARGTLEGVTHEMTVGTFSYGQEGGPFIESTIINNQGPDAAEDYTILQLDFGLEDAPAIVAESRRPDLFEVMSAADFDAFVAEVFGNNPDLDCIEADK